MTMLAIPTTIPAELPALLTVEQAAEVLGVTPGTLDTWRCTKRYAIPFVKIGRLVRYKRADLLAWIESRTTGNAA